jgi:hypothetical protein
MLSKMRSAKRKAIMRTVLAPFVVAGVVGGLLLSGCATRLSSDVARFHQMAAPQGETFRIVPLKPELAGSLEFGAYAKLVSDKMTAAGFKPAGDAASAQLEVRLDYDVSDARNRVRTIPGSGFGGRAGFYRSSRFGYWPGFYDPFWGSPFWDEPEIVTTTEYTRSMTLRIARVGAGAGAKAGDVFEGTVESIGRDGRLPEVMPYLVQAMFTNFPGQSGKTERVVIELPNRQ